MPQFTFGDIRIAVDWMLLHCHPYCSSDLPLLTVCCVRSPKSDTWFLSSCRSMWFLEISWRLLSPPCQANVLESGSAWTWQMLMPTLVVWHSRRCSPWQAADSLALRHRISNLCCVTQQTLPAVSHRRYCLVGHTAGIVRCVTL